MRDRRHRRVTSRTTGSLRGTLLPVSQEKVRELVRRVPFGASLARADAPMEISGYAVMLSMPTWLNELLGNALTKRVVRELESIQAHVLIHLQLLDDVMDGQSQIGPGDPAVPRGIAEQRLTRLFNPGDPFWRDYQRLSNEQEAAARWEIAGRGAPLPRLDDALFDAIASKGALLRWPASAVARLAGRPRAVRLLDDVFARVLGVVLLFDDLSDFEEDAGRGQINAVLCAGGISSRDPLHFYPNVLRGARAVCDKARVELAWLKKVGPSGGGLAAMCDHWSARCGEVLEPFAIRCQAATAGYIFGSLAAPRGTSADAAGNPR